MGVGSSSPSNGLRLASIAGLLAVACQSGEPKRVPLASAQIALTASAPPASTPSFVVSPPPATAQLGWPRTGYRVVPGPDSPPPDLGKWDASCQSQLECKSKRKVLQPCSADDDYVQSWTVLRAHADERVGKPVAVAGMLEHAPVVAHDQQVACAPGACCRALRVAVTLDGLLSAPTPLALPGLVCSGDDSMLCCDVPIGHRVVARGRLLKVKKAGHESWELANASLCLRPPRRDY
jgi:hypothetical protein